MVAVSRQSVAGPEMGATWHMVLTKLIGASKTSIGHDGHFLGEVTRSRLGSLHLVRILSSREHSRRTAGHVRSDPQDRIILVNVISGSVHLEQGNVQQELPAGSFTLYRTDRPFVWQHRERTMVRNVVLPEALLRKRIRNLDGFLLRPYSAARGLWRVASDLMDSLGAQLESVPEEATHGCAAQIIDLVSLALESSEAEMPLGDAAHSAIYRCCCGFIRTHLADDGLGPELIAASVGLSVRSLHRVFQETGVSVGEFVRNARLEKCRADLENPAKAELSVGEIAWQAGFRSQAHFTNAFRLRYGMSPRGWRGQRGACSNARPIGGDVASHSKTASKAGLPVQGRR